ALGNLTLLGFHGLDLLRTAPGLEILAQLGVILLLFQVGLESNVAEMLSVGWSSLLVAVLGVIAPFFLGWGVSAWMLPDEETLAHVFIGATLCATSVGITARVLADLGRLSARESKIILGAAGSIRCTPWPSSPSPSPSWSARSWPAGGCRSGCSAWRVSCGSRGRCSR